MAYRTSSPTQRRWEVGKVGAMGFDRLVRYPSRACDLFGGIRFRDQAQDVGPRCAVGAGGARGLQ